MNHAFLNASRLVALGLIWLCASSAGAVTTATGSYYATPSWDQTLPASTRFIVLTNMASQAVLDRETGLVWEQSPQSGSLDWLGASFHCMNLSTGGRTGWKLPTIQELLSLVDRSVPSPGPSLPSGHPFTNVQSDFYWSATTGAGSFAGSAGLVNFNDGGLHFFVQSATEFVWCVRGGSGPDAQ